MNCERCDKLGFGKCHCSNNYQLYLFGHTIPDGTFKYLDAAIEAGKENNVPFTVNLVSPEMIVCFWQPSMSEVAYNKYYEDYMADCQRELQRVTG